MMIPVKKFRMIMLPADLPAYMAAGKPVLNHQINQKK